MTSDNVELLVDHLNAHPVRLYFAALAICFLADPLYRMEGFIIFDYAKQYANAREELARWLSEGKIQRKETIIKGGLSKAEQALVDLYAGVNTGKS